MSAGPPGSAVVEKSRRKRGGPPQNSAPALHDRSASSAAALAQSSHKIPVPDALDSIKTGTVKLCHDFLRDVPANFRGIHNSSNFCYIAALTQALVHCPPFAHLCTVLATDKKSRCPIGAALGSWFVNQYWKRGGGPAPAPRLALNMNGIAADGRTQQDAHEFFLFVLDALSQECEEVGLHPAQHPQRSQEPDELSARAPHAESQKGWTVVGRGQEKLKVREHHDVVTTAETNLVASIFRGTLHSHVKGSKSTKKNQVSVTVDPFFVLPIDIGCSSRVSLDEAISYTLSKERIATDEGESLTKLVRLGTLPQILVIQLSRYAVTREGELVKLDNVVEFDTHLRVQQQWCASGCTTAAAPGEKPHLPHFQLLSVVCHRGAEPGRGHYVTYLHLSRAQQAMFPVDASGSPTQFVCANDSYITPASLQECIRDTPYLLFYQRVQ